MEQVRPVDESAARSGFPLINPRSVARKTGRGRYVRKPSLSRIAGCQDNTTLNPKETHVHGGGSDSNIAVAASRIICNYLLRTTAPTNRRQRGTGLSEQAQAPMCHRRMMSPWCRQLVAETSQCARLAIVPERCRAVRGLVTVISIE